jgi:hypothetical protein
LLKNRSNDNKQRYLLFILRSKEWHLDMIATPTSIANRGEKKGEDPAHTEGGKKGEDPVHTEREDSTAQKVRVRVRVTARFRAPGL